MTQKKEHSWNEWDYENRRTPVWVMMLTSASCFRHVQQHSAWSFSVHQDSDISTQGTAPVYVIGMSEEHDVMSSTREDVIRRRHVLLQCADSSLNHEWSKTASFVSCLDACLDAVGVRPSLEIPCHSALKYFQFEAIELQSSDLHRTRPKDLVLESLW
jgi:hypothetical protein